jgi:Fe-S-cluster containining protein
VYITQQDLLRAAAYVGMTPDLFERKYVVRTKHILRLRKPRIGQCSFLVESGCSIHPAKPTQCRTYPFWPELVEHRENWAEAASTCPGIGTGPLIQIGAAMERANEMRLAYPGMYDDSPME